MCLSWGPCSKSNQSYTSHHHKQTNTYKSSANRTECVSRVSTRIKIIKNVHAKLMLFRKNIYVCLSARLATILKHNTDTHMRTQVKIRRTGFRPSSQMEKKKNCCIRIPLAN